MLNINDLAQAKKTARALEKALERNGIALQHGKALDVLAALCGRGDWNALSQALSPQGVDAQLSEFEREHAASCEGLDYGKEAMLVAHTGFQLRYSAETELCEYVRVCDPLGREIVYWNSDEWAEDPQLVMGALLGALVRGKPMPVELAKRKAATAKAATPAPASLRMPTIQDVPFCDIGSAVVNGSGGYRAMWHDENLVDMLQDPSDPDFEDNADETALYLEKEDEGRVLTVELTLAKLAALQWDPVRQLFVDPKGKTYEFYFPASMVQWLALSPTFGSSPATAALPATGAATPEQASQDNFPLTFEDGEPVKCVPDGYQLFTARFRFKLAHAVPVTVRVLGRDEAEAAANLAARYGDVAVLSMGAAERKPKLYNAVMGHDNAPVMQVTTRIAGYDEADARLRLLAVFKGIPGAHLATVQLTPCAPGEVDEFLVYVDGGFYNTVPTLEQALNLAEVLEPTGSDEVSIEDQFGNCLWTVPCQNKDEDNDSGSTA